MRGLAAALMVFLVACSGGDPSPVDGTPGGSPKPIRFDLSIPQPGATELRILSPTMLELMLVTTMPPAALRPSVWDFVDSAGQLTLPPVAKLAVLVDGHPATVTRTGFKRRVLYSPLARRDLRIGNYLYLELAKPLGSHSEVRVENPDQTLWSPSQRFVATMAGLRYSPTIHVNQVGYAPNGPKRAFVGYYLGSLGELDLPAGSPFTIVDADSDSVRFQGLLASRLETGFPNNPGGYQKVLEADFSSFTRPGRYRLAVGNLASLPFTIDDGVTATFARTYALGLLTQRSGMAVTRPYTRFTHGADHTQPAAIPTLDPLFAAFNALIAQDSVIDDPRQTAPALIDVAASLYPFVRQGTVDVSQGHFDAGDYSKYTLSSAQLLHYLMFAVDNFAGVAALDNLGIPESGDGKSDVLQEAMWEADFLAKMQDDDGGVYVLVYPQTRRFEFDRLPDQGDPQAVYPKTTAATAAAVAALATAGSSPTLRRQFPARANLYLAAAQRGWVFLEQAIATHGGDGSYQKLYWGQFALHDDEMASAAAALYAATGDPKYQTSLFTYLPNPRDPTTYQHGWVRLHEGYGNAIRSYAFAAHSGRLAPSQLDPAYLAACKAEVKAAADDRLQESQTSAYALSLPLASRAWGLTGWFFAGSRSFDMIAAYQLYPNPDYLDATLSNFNYEAGANPLNVSFLAGVGWRRPREMVHQMAQNDGRVLPPSGIVMGSVVQGYDWNPAYSPELASLSYPADGGWGGQGYGFYDRWADNYNLYAESGSQVLALSLGPAAFLMARSTLATQAWQSAEATIHVPPVLFIGERSHATLSATTLDLNSAQIVWEGTGQEPTIAPAFDFIPVVPGQNWIEAELLMPDGRRVAAGAEFRAVERVTTTINDFQPLPLSDGRIIAWYNFDGVLTDGKGSGTPLIPTGAAAVDSASFSWANSPQGGALRVGGLADSASATLPGPAIDAALAAGSLSIEAMLYVKSFNPQGLGSGYLLSMAQNNFDTYLSLYHGLWADPSVEGGFGFSLPYAAWQSAFALGRWNHLRLQLTTTDYAVWINGSLITRVPTIAWSTWSNARPTQLQIGQFTGWIDDVVIRAGP